MDWISPAHRRWILVNALVVTALLNLAFNALVAWLSVRGHDSVPLWSTGRTSTITDTLGTLFLLPLITCVLCTGAVWKELRVGRLERIEDLARRRPGLAALPASRVLRSVALGLLGVVLLAAPVALALVAIGVGDLSPGAFIAYKALFAVALGALITPMIALRAMADQVEPPPSAE